MWISSCTIHLFGPISSYLNMTLLSKASIIYMPQSFPSTITARSTYRSILECREYTLTLLQYWMGRRKGITNCVIKPHTMSIITFEFIVGLSVNIFSSSPFSTSKPFKEQKALFDHTNLKAKLLKTWWYPFIHTDTVWFGGRERK